jgi:hypothetical protein
MEFQKKIEQSKDIFDAMGVTTPGENTLKKMEEEISENSGIKQSRTDPNKEIKFTCQCQAHEQDSHNLRPHTAKFVEMKNNMISSFINAIALRRGPKIEYFKMKKFRAFFEPKFQQLCLQLEICTEANKEICSLIRGGDKEKLGRYVRDQLWRDTCTWECGKRFIYSVEDLITAVFGLQDIGEGDPDFAGSWFVEEYIASWIRIPTKYLWDD